MTRGRRLQLVWANYQNRCYLRVNGWTDVELRELGNLSGPDLNRRLAVLPSDLVEAGAQIFALQPLAGRFEIDGDGICFIPRFPFMDSMSYSLLVDSVLGGETVDGPEVWAIEVPPSVGGKKTRVAAIYPSANVLPLNQLKLYVHFSSTMSTDWAISAVHVRREDTDQPLEGVFLANGPELWDTERRRLTLMLDPGRIKRGLSPNIEIGYPFKQGMPIIVTVDRTFLDAKGQRLTGDMVRRYEIGPALRSRIDPMDWSYNQPTTGSRDKFIVKFDRSLDHALLKHSLWITDMNGLPVKGFGSIGPQERSWHFKPDSCWQEGRYALHIDSRLEDLAGNSLVRVFDRDLTRTTDALIGDWAGSIYFSGV